MARNSQNHIYIPADPERKPSWFWVIALFLCGSFTGPIGPLVGAYLAYKRIKRDGKIKKLGDFRRMANVIGDRQSISIRELTAKLGMTVEQVTGGLQEMIDQGYIGGSAYIDHSELMLYLSREAGESAPASTINININGQRTGVQVNTGSEASWRGAHSRPMKPIYASEQHRAEEAPAEESPAPAQKPRPKPRRTGTEDEDFENKLREIRELNDAIEDAAVSERIDRIGELTASIFRVVREKPEHSEEVRKFMNYYLPTTLKLLKSYSLMEKQSYQGENIQASRKKIEDVLDTLIHAFEQQQDRLFRSEALDVESDISVLETMMASDGLLEREGGLTLQAGGSGRK